MASGWNSRLKSTQACAAGRGVVHGLVRSEPAQAAGHQPR